MTINFYYRIVMYFLQSLRKFGNVGSDPLYFFCKCKVNCYSLAFISPRFALVTCDMLEFWFVLFIVCVFCDWLDCVLWFWFYSTKTAPSINCGFPFLPPLYHLCMWIHLQHRTFYRYKSSDVVLHCYKLLCHYILHCPESINIHNKTVLSFLHSGHQISSGELSWKPVMD